MPLFVLIAGTRPHLCIFGINLSHAEVALPSPKPTMQPTTAPSRKHFSWLIPEGLQTCTWKCFFGQEPVLFTCSLSQLPEPLVRISPKVKTLASEKKQHSVWFNTNNSLCFINTTIRHYRHLQANFDYSHAGSVYPMLYSPQVLKRQMGPSVALMSR